MKKIQCELTAVSGKSLHNIPSPQTPAGDHDKPEKPELGRD